MLLAALSLSVATAASDSNIRGSSRTIIMQLLDVALILPVSPSIIGTEKIRFRLFILPLFQCIDAVPNV